MQEITMLTTYLLTKFHDFSVYLISGTWSTTWNFSRDQKGKCINVHVTKGVHGLWRPHRTKPRPGGPKRCPVDPTLADRSHFGAKSSLPWWVHVLGGGKGSTNLTRLVWPRIMVGHLLSRKRCCQVEEPPLGRYKYPPTLSTGIHTPYSRFSTCKGSGALVVA
jgi:hypothetical protein